MRFARPLIDAGTFTIRLRRQPLAIISAFLLFVGSTSGPQVLYSAPATWYVAPNGRSVNPGTIDQPLDLATALSRTSPAKPGDTIWMRGGTYNGSFTSYLTGTPTAPIIVRQYPGERATIDTTAVTGDGLFVNGGWTWYWGFEIRNGAANRYSTAAHATDISRGTGVTSHAPGARFINLIIHDMRIGVGIWSSSPDSEVYGSLIYHNGYEAADRGHGHGIYSQNLSGTRKLTDNILFGGFSHGIHAYGSDAAALNNIQLEGNIVFNSGVLWTYFDRNILLGGGRLAENSVVKRNYTYYGAERRGGENNIGYAAGCSNLVAEGNYWAHLGQYPLAIQTNCTGIVQNNVMVGAASNELRARFPANTYFGQTAPTGVQAFVRPNRYETGRSNVVVYNWARSAAVSVSLAGTGLNVGDYYEIRDVQDYFGQPVTAGTYLGTPVQIPMTSTYAAPPAGSVQRIPAHTTSQFGAFIVMPRETPPQSPDPVVAPTPEPTVAHADLTVSQVVSPLTATAGASLTNVITIRNQGPNPATNATIQIANRAEAAVIAGVSTTSSQCRAVTATDVSCSIASLASGATHRVAVSMTTANAGTIVSTAAVASATNDPAPANNTHSVSTSITASAPTTGTTPNLKIAQAVSYGTSATGRTIVLTLTVTNAGELQPAVAVKDMVRAEPWVIRSILSAASSQGRCQTGYPTTCALGSMPAGSTAVIKITLVPRFARTFTSEATVTGSIEEPNLADNVATITAVTMP